MSRSVLPIYVYEFRAISKFRQLSFTKFTTIGRWLHSGGGRVVMVSLVGMAMFYAGVALTIDIKSPGDALAIISDPLAKVSLITPQKKKAPNIVKSSVKPDPKKCGYGKIENMETASCEWISHVNRRDEDDKIVDQAVAATLLRVMEAQEAGKINLARKLLEPALLQGHPIAQLLAARFFYDGYVLEKDKKKAMELVKLAVSQNERMAKMQLAEWLTEDCNETCPNVHEALALYRAASKAGIHEATEKIARIYFLGIGLPKSVETALPFIKSAAKGGMEISQRILATMFLDGEHVPKSDELALEWFKKSANQGDAKSMEKLGIMHLAGMGTQMAPRKGILWTWLAAQKDQPLAQFLVGTFLFDGVVVAEDRIRGLMWLKISAANGNDRAKDLLKKLQGNLNDTEIKLAKLFAEQCKNNRKKCGKPPWKWAGFKGENMGPDDI